MMGLALFPPFFSYALVVEAQWKTFYKSKTKPFALKYIKCLCSALDYAIWIKVLDFIELRFWEENTYEAQGECLTLQEKNYWSLYSLKLW